MEKVSICCLKGVGDKQTKSKLIPLEDKIEVVIGRSIESTVCIPSAMISRCHAVLSKSNHVWSITDKKSLNGVFVNGKKLSAEVPCELKEGDVIQLGVADNPKSSPEFVWKYLTKCRVKKLKTTVTKAKIDDQESEIKDTDDISPTQSRKRNMDNMELEDKTSTMQSSPVKRQRQISPDSGPVWSPSRDMQLKLQQQEKLAQEKLAAQEAQLKELQAKLLQKERMQEQMKEQLQKKEEEVAQKLAEKQRELEEKRQQLEATVRENYEREIQQKEEALLSRLSEEKVRLRQDKLRIEESLKKEMERKLEEKDKDLETRLLAEKERLESIIVQRDSEHQLLQNELRASKSMAQQEQASILKAKEDILINFTQLLETELQCSICNELFVQATSLNCSHSFCFTCITQWMDVKKECPNCRTRITSHNRSLVLDSYIDKMVENLSDDMKEKRKAVIEERKEDLKRREEKAAQAPGTSSSRRGRGRGGRRGRRTTGTARSRRTAAAATQAQGVLVIPDTPGDNSSVRTRSATVTGSATVTAGPVTVEDLGAVEEVTDEPIVVESGSSDVEEVQAAPSDDDDDDRYSWDYDPGSVQFSEDQDSDSSVEGVEGVYFGGYGQCFRCGRRGHWANGCPFY